MRITFCVCCRHNSYESSAMFLLEATCRFSSFTNSIHVARQLEKHLEYDIKIGLVLGQFAVIRPAVTLLPYKQNNFFPALTGFSGSRVKPRTQQ
jgi:hypothetical protein